jgi:hypothetical protein
MASTTDKWLTTPATIALSSALVWISTTFSSILIKPCTMRDFNSWAYLGPWHALPSCSRVLFLSSCVRECSCVVCCVWWELVLLSHLTYRVIKTGFESSLISHLFYISIQVIKSSLKNAIFSKNIVKIKKLHFFGMNRTEKNIESLECMKAPAILLWLSLPPTCHLWPSSSSFLMRQQQLIEHCRMAESIVINCWK